MSTAGDWLLSRVLGAITYLIGLLTMLISQFELQLHIQVAIFDGWLVDDRWMVGGGWMIDGWFQVGEVD